MAARVRDCAPHHVKILRSADLKFVCIIHTAHWPVFYYVDEEVLGAIEQSRGSELAS